MSINPPELTAVIRPRPGKPSAGEGTEWADKAVGTPAQYRFDILPAEALFAVAQLRHEVCERHGEDGIDNWKNSNPKQHVNKALAHLYLYLLGDDSEKNGDPVEHVTHACCRIMFALHILKTAPGTFMPPLQPTQADVEAQDRATAAKITDMLQSLDAAPASDAREAIVSILQDTCRMSGKGG